MDWQHMIEWAFRDRKAEHTDLWHAIQPKAEEQTATRPTRRKEIKSH
jgi:hypothetical protein